MINDIGNTCWDNIDSLLVPHFVEIGFEDYLYLHSNRRDVLTNWPRSVALDYAKTKYPPEFDEPSIRMGAVTYLWGESATNPASERSLEFLPPIPAKSGIVLFIIASSTDYSVLCLSRRVDGPFDYELVPEVNMVATALSMKAKTARTGFEAGSLDVLSIKQQTILRWIAEGKSNFAISVICGLTQRNVDYHVAQILSKLGVSSRAQAAAIFAAFNRQT